MIGSAAFVGWYNGHPEFADLDPPLDVAAAAVIGNGNVALDVARILAKTPAEFAGSDIVAHAFSTLGNARDPHDPRARPARAAPDRDDAQGAGRARPSRGCGAASSTSPISRPSSTTPCSSPASASRSPICASFAEPGRRTSARRSSSISSPSRSRIEGEGKVERLIVEKTRLDDKGAAVGTGETYAIPCGLVVTCIGYKTPPIEGVAL